VCVLVFDEKVKNGIKAAADCAPSVLAKFYELS
jgi:hypothetical protein